MPQSESQPILDDNGLRLEYFDQLVASVLGNERGMAGARVAAEVLSRDGSVIGIRDWLYRLVSQPGTELRREIIDKPGKSDRRFIEIMEGGLDDDPDGFAPESLTLATVAPDVVTMLSLARDIATNLQPPHGSGLITDKVLSRAVLECADSEITRLLAHWMTPDGLSALKARLFRETEPSKELPSLFRNGKLDMAAFAQSGKQFCNRMREDVVSMGAAKVTTRHMLYTLLSSADGILPTAFAATGVDVKRELHATLSRELAGKAKNKRNDDFELTQETLFAAVVDVLNGAQTAASTRGVRIISEGDIHKSFLARQLSELTRLFHTEHPMDVPAIRSYVEEAEVEPEEEHGGGGKLPIREIENRIRERICGQDAAITQIVPWIKRLRFGLPRDGRPAAVFLFLGPTGTGKTQLAKELARYVFGDEDMLIYLEMGQFKTKEAMNMFIGAPPGYVGYGDGKLTNGLRDKPECVVLFDEIEKADTQVFDTLLRFADEGLISDPAGPVRDGRKCIIVMTTNAGQQWLRAWIAGETDEKGSNMFGASPKPTHSEYNQQQQINLLPGGDEGIKAGASTDRATDPNLPKYLFDNAIKELQVHGFRPEFLGRLDERVTFLPFTVATCRKIVDGVLEREISKISKHKGLTVSVDDDARNILAACAHSRSMDEGARGAPRAVNEQIITRLIDELSDMDETAVGQITAIKFCGEPVSKRIELSIELWQTNAQ